METLIVDIVIGPEEWIKLYNGSATNVRTVSRDGRTVRFPARILSRFALRDGVRGSFMISFDGEGKFHSIERIGG